MIAHVPGLDNAKAFARTGAVGLLNMQQAFAKNQPIVVIDETTGKRQLIYSQLDANATNPQNPGPALRALVVALEQWVTRDIAPPTSRVPSLAAGTAVAAASVRMPAQLCGQRVG